MLYKVATVLSHGEEDGYTRLVYPRGYNDHLEKTASDPVAIEALRSFAHEHLPQDSDKVHTLISAMGASEYYGSNSNGDIFSERALQHKPERWDTMSYQQQKTEGKQWEWGFPTFYNALQFMHHGNKVPEKAIGTVEYTTWDDHMKRVLLIVSFSRGAADKFGGSNTIRKIDAGEPVAVSMGARLLFDYCSVCVDWPRLVPFGDNPTAILTEHHRKPIRGVSTDKNGYCTHIRTQNNAILPNGVRVGMINPYPRFFDISAVYIGADKTSFVLAKLASAPLWVA
jgi:hypothetical protein